MSIDLIVILGCLWTIIGAVWFCKASRKLERTGNIKRLGKPQAVTLVSSGGPLIWALSVIFVVQQPSTGKLNKKGLYYWVVARCFLS